MSAGRNSRLYHFAIQQAQSHLNAIAKTEKTIAKNHGWLDYCLDSLDEITEIKLFSLDNSVEIILGEDTNLDSHSTVDTFGNDNNFRFLDTLSERILTETPAPKECLSHDSIRQNYQNIIVSMKLDHDRKYLRLLQKIDQIAQTKNNSIKVSSANKSFQLQSLITGMQGDIDIAQNRLPDNIGPHNPDKLDFTRYMIAIVNKALEKREQNPTAFTMEQVPIDNGQRSAYKVQYSSPTP